MTALALPPRALPPVAAPELCSDEALARRAGAGDDAAYAVIYTRYHARIEAYCRAIVRHDEDARDAAQTAMTKALVAMRSERGGLHLRSWLYRIAHNEALTVLRRRRNHDELTDALEGRDTDPVIEVLLREQLRAMLDGLRGLPASHREALLLRELGGLDYATVAGVVGMTPGATRQAVFRARRALRAERAGFEQPPCSEIRNVLADHDGRRRRARRVRAHLRSCRACREWDAARPARARALAALPAAWASSAATWLWSWIGGAAAGSPGGIGAAAAAKVVTGVAVIAAGTTPIAQREIVPHRASPPVAQRRAAAPTPSTTRQALRTSRAARPVAVAPSAAATAVTPPASHRAARAGERPAQPESRAPRRHTTPTTTPGRHATDAPVGSSDQVATAGAPRGRDGAPGGRGPDGAPALAGRPGAPALAGSPDAAAPAR
jgi:RNA polymerase sigma factor (sigma-70 family)